MVEWGVACAWKGAGGCWVFVLHEWERAVGIRLALRGRWPLCDQTLKPLCHPANQTPVIFKVVSPSTRYIHLFLFILFFPDLLLQLFCQSYPLVFLISVSSFCLQLPSPTAMSTALRGISCYLREVTTWLLCFGQPDPPSVYLSS